MRWTTLLFLMISFSLQAQKPIKVGDVNSPNEPSININRKDPNKIVCGANINSLYVSNDAGESWELKKMTSTYGVWGDPVVISDSSGRFYYFHLSNPPQGNWIDRIVCQTSSDFGKTWSSGSYTGLSGKKAQDKHWAVFSEEKKEVYVSWTQFDKYGSLAEEHKSNILFSSSKDFGESWSDPIQLNKVSGDCKDSSLTTEGAVPTFDNNQNVYVAWAGPAGIRLNNRVEGKWLSEPILVDENKSGWTISIPGISRCNGMPVTGCDRSGSEFEGRLYVNWGDQRRGLDNTDIMLKYSDDQGETWSEPVVLGKRKAKNHQFLSWMAIDQTTGAVYIVYYDRSRFKDNRTDVVLARSYNGGKSFIYKRIPQKPFLPKSNKFFGDYNNIDAHNGVVQLVWTRMEDGDTSVWTYRFTERKGKLKRLKSKTLQQK